MGWLGRLCEAVWPPWKRRWALNRIQLQWDCTWLGWDIFRGEIIIGGCGLLLGNSL